ncbi:hypothetical protein [Rhodococcus sp. 1168]|uniref:hypothetical protein n=1 Tax=Rhodococcus sp. 1168 TaxID=2018041 RepID=UPI0020CB0D19|nr:hypothetical protein [Rhodococcus sp. 1168]
MSSAMGFESIGAVAAVEPVVVAVHPARTIVAVNIATAAVPIPRENLIKRSTSTHRFGARTRPDSHD